ncbi:hypothetical protein FRC17_004028 [Serendipita sp. 399]|nr:hypothetical protein FRC17_004028 [Serendipita sp. 399]
MIGRPRPDFLSRCQPDLTRVQASLSTTAVTLFNSTICTTTEKKALNDGFRSFPSGHSSMSFAGLTFASLYLAGRFRLFTPHSAHGKHLYAYVLSFAPLLLASYVSTSRVSDFRHRGSDVLGGASLGVIFALLAYRYYFPWLGSRDAGTPWMILREEGAFYDSKTHSRSGSNFGVPLLPTVAPSSQQQTYVDDAGVNTQPIQLNPLPQINVHTPPENPANR